ncbi:SDR family NAD(P)-dependent oxidoreductase [Fusibacter paucivorans]|uniref:SDR family NAD(P)-dependent oxidoreductase n=1 Tax=Fusibacter paucivorans TaxID=76009 RepID=A0ABS5PMD7_9FIRM|nr:SDR family NAD(P)-dependent oxidoreductase [Fusibacter paucivorans]
MNYRSDDEKAQAFASIELLVNNAGSDFTKTAFQSIETSEWRKVQEGTLNAAFFVGCEFAHHLLIRRLNGCIVNMLSKSAILSSSVHNAAYIAAKGGLMTLTRGMAKELIVYA